VVAAQPASATDKFVFLGWLHHADNNVTLEMPPDGSSEGTFWVGDDGGDPAEFCGLRSAFHCIRSYAIAFAVPKAGVLPAEWEHEGIRCVRVAAGRTISLLGRSLPDTYLVRCHGLVTADEPNETREYGFAFSREVGLIGIAPPDNKTVYWLESARGPFSSH